MEGEKMSIELEDDYGLQSDEFLDNWAKDSLSLSEAVLSLPGHALLSRLHFESIGIRESVATFRRTRKLETKGNLVSKKKKFEEVKAIEMRCKLLMEDWGIFISEIRKVRIKMEAISNMKHIIRLDETSTNVIMAEDYEIHPKRKSFFEVEAQQPSVVQAASPPPPLPPMNSPKVAKLTDTHQLFEFDEKDSWLLNFDQEEDSTF